MKSGTVARRYARALLNIALDEKALQEVGGDLESLAGMLRQNPQLDALINNPMLSGLERSEVVLQIADKAGFHPLTRTFLKLLGHKGRLGYAEAIAAAFRVLADQTLGRLRAEVRSTAPLMPEELQQIQKALAARTGKQIIVDTATDPDLLGGVVARVGDTVYDSSVRSHLRRLRQSIVEA
ncbi:MAG: F0F1 ATP synthase subunit delta [Pseudomonadota bacterium]